MTITELSRRDASLPYPTGDTERWVPSRAGILNVWRYYDEVFEFHKGRLLLRGPNGTGKSKALELLLPYLLDASLRAHRLSTFGTGERSMWWNLMGEGATGTTRVGYVWLEFLRGSAEHPEWLCCGARLQASQHTKTPTADYFTTSLRIGVPGGLRLTNDSGAPLTKAALSDGLGEYGTLHPSASDYRTALRHTLFPELTEQRYEAMITALLQLRQPKLSERLDPGLLSSLLSRALPPLGQTEISELAEGFERLDRQRDQLRQLDEEVEAAGTVASRQATYAQRVLRAGAAELISATTDLDTLTRKARDSEQQYQQATEQNGHVEQRKQDREHHREQLESRIQGLTERDEYQQGKELDRLRQESEAAQRAARTAHEEAGQKQETAQTDRQKADTAEQAARSAAQACTAARQDAEQAAWQADIRSVLEELAAALESDRGARSLLTAAVASRKTRIDAVLRAVGEYDTALNRRHDAEEQLEHARSVLAEASTQRERRAEAYQTAVDEQAERLHHWAESTVELRFEDLDALTDSAESEAAVLRLVEPASQAAVQTITEERTTTSAQRNDLHGQREKLTAEVQRLRQAVDLPPEPPLTRTTDRSIMEGAPLWKLVVFAGDVPAQGQAAIEAALQASGLLDAWVPAHGKVQIAEHDTFLEIDQMVPVSGGSLANVLAPEPDAPVPVERIERLLAAIAYDRDLPDGEPMAVGADGRWRLVGATGSWAKTQIAHIGAAARDRARNRRIAELNGNIAELDSGIAALDERLERLDERRRQLDTDLAARPRHEHVTQAHGELQRAESRESAADSTVRSWLETLNERDSAVRSALRSLTTLAAEHGLPAEREALHERHRTVDHFRELADTWLDRHAELARLRESTQTLDEQAQRSAQAAQDKSATAEQADSHARDLAAKREAVESTIGVDYRQILAELGELREQFNHTKELITADQERLRELSGRIGSLRTQHATDVERRDEATEKRDTAAVRFRRLGTSSLADDAGIELTASTSDGVRVTLEAARAVAGKWPNLPHTPRNLSDALTRLSESVHKCRDTLSRRADLILEPHEDVQLFTAAMDGLRVGATRLVAILRDEAERARDDITEHERDLFDRTLTGDTRRHLADRIRQAGDLVEQMNGRLQRVRTASNVAVRLVWQVDPDLPAGTKAARDLLLKDPVRLSDEDRASLHQFFRERIEQARADNVAASWEQQLVQVFDYTAWHQFVVKIDRANGEGWQLLTKKLHGALSGGEKAIALHLPLFAAVAAHYQTATSAPRLILLDEVFVGVDATNRGQVFELLSSLDLDLVLTSDHEWCTYSELDGIAVHQLITGGDDDAVTTARFTWDGYDLHPDQENE